MSERAWMTGAARRCWQRWSLAAVVGLWAAAAGAAETVEPPVRIGYTQSVFKGRNEADVLAAMKVWAQTIAKAAGINVDPNMTIFASLTEAAAAVRAKRVDALTLSLPEYAAFPSGLLNGPFLRDEINGSTLVEYALVAAKDGPIKQWRDLRGARVIVHDSAHVDVGLAWLEAQLAIAGLGRLREMAAGVELSEKPSAAVLNVFFGKADACLVRRSVLDSVAELNPQVAAKLTPVATSPPVAPSLLAFRTGMSPELRDRLLREALRLEETTTGKQVLRVFKSDRMQIVTAAEAEQSARLFEGWQQTAAGRPQAQAGFSPTGAQR